MRILFSLVSIGVLVFSNTQSLALGCRDISGARIDPDLKILSTNFGRLLPDRKKITEKKQQSQSFSIERVVATRLRTDDGNAMADLVLTGQNATVVSAVIDGKKINKTVQNSLAGLGYRGSTAKIISALEKIDKPAEAFVAPRIRSGIKLADLSETNGKISAGQHNLRITGTPTTEKQTTIQYTCTKDAEFAGDPAVLRSMVVLRGVLKATTIVKTTIINRSVVIKVSDVATLQTVSRDQFQKTLAPVPGISQIMSTAQLVQQPEKPSLPPLPAPPPVPDTTASTGTPDAQTPGVERPLPTNAPRPGTSTFAAQLVEFFSLSKPGTWILLFVTMILTGITFLSLKRPKRPDENIPSPETVTLAREESPDESAPPEKQIETLAAVAKSNEQLQEKLQSSLEKATSQITREKELTAKINGLKSDIETANEQARLLRKTNLELKAQIDAAENTSRELTTQVIEAQTSSALMESQLTADQRSVMELEGSNQRLMGINEGYRESIKKIEAEHTALMVKLNLREDALAHVEKLNNEMLGFNEEINHAFIQERAARTSLEAEFERLSQDYNTLWASSSDRVAQFRAESAAHKARIREMRDDLISLETELNLLRKERDDLNREFIILGNENARTNNEHKVATSLLENKIKQLHLDLAAYRQILDENRIPIPDMSRLTSPSHTSRYSENYQAGRQQVQDENTPTADNVVPLPRKNTGRDN